MGQCVRPGLIWLGLIFVHETLAKSIKRLGEKVKMTPKEAMKIEFKYPWRMTYSEDAKQWVGAVKSTLQPSDLLYGKEIFVSGKHQIEPLLLVDNKTDGTYAIVGVEYNSKTGESVCHTVEIILTSEELAKKLKKDHREAIA